MKKKLVVLGLVLAFVLSAGYAISANMNNSVSRAHDCKMAGGHCMIDLGDRDLVIKNCQKSTPGPEANQKPNM